MSARLLLPAAPLHLRAAACLLVLDLISQLIYRRSETPQGGADTLKPLRSLIKTAKPERSSNQAFLPFAFASTQYHILNLSAWLLHIEEAYAA